MSVKAIAIAAALVFVSTSAFAQNSEARGAGLQSRQAQSRQSEQSRQGDVRRAGLQSRQERGKYLVSIAACHDCHSPKINAQMDVDTARLLSGRPMTTMPPAQGKNDIRSSLDLTAWSGPWGNSYAANLTPDETGLGNRYTEASFIKTIRTGKKPEGEDLAPPMPWTQYRNMTDDDLKAVFAYLRTLKPVKNIVRATPPVTTTTRR